jgi:hypothetical protein
MSERTADNRGNWMDDDGADPAAEREADQQQRQKQPGNGKDHIDGSATANRTFTRHTTLRDEKDLPKRPWIAPGFLLRAAVTLLFGPPDQGKTLLLVAWAVALAVHREWGSFQPKGAYRVLTIFAEEDNDEQQARFAAAIRAFGLERSQVEPNLRRLVVPNLATLFEVDVKGTVRTTSGWDDLRQEIIEFQPDVVIADPLIEFHTAEENDNTKLKAVIGYFRSLAREFNLAVLLSHHTRKGELVPGSLEMARGASATGGAVRIAYTFLEALEADVERLNIAAHQRRYFCRLDRARASQAPPTINDADWFEKRSYVLDNADATPALVPIEPPEAVIPGQIEMVRLLADIAKGYVPTGSGAPAGDPWSPQLRDTEPRSIRALLRRHGVNAASEDATMKALHAEGVHVADYRVPRRSEPRKGFRTRELKPAADWIDQQPNQAAAD